MFSTLDLIDWEGLGNHTYSRQDKIPQAIRQLLSPDEATREEARGFLLGQGQDFGDIYDTTPQIILFCLEVLRMDGAPGKAELMQQLSGQGIYIANSGVRSIYMMDLCLQTYAALQAGLDLYLDLLVEGDRDERLAACELLQYLTDDPEQLISKLLEQIDLEADEAVQVSLLYCLKQLLGSPEWPRFLLKGRYAPELRAIVDGHPTHIVRVAAARASVELVRQNRMPNDDLLSKQVAKLLAQEFLQPGPPMHWSEGYPSLYQESLVRDLARLSDPLPLLHLLDEPGITAEQANLLARGLLCQAVVPQVGYRWHWQQMPRREKAKAGDFFLYERIIPPWKLKTERVRSILQAIIAEGRIWERPSNLFSYFYGLPNSRDEPRRLVEEMGA